MACGYYSIPASRLQVPRLVTRRRDGPSRPRPTSPLLVFRMGGILIECRSEDSAGFGGTEGVVSIARPSGSPLANVPYEDKLLRCISPPRDAFAVELPILDKVKTENWVG